MEINLLIRLIIAHLLTDFILQPKSWVKDREEKKGKSTKLYLHVLITAAVAYLLSGQYTNWVIPFVIFTTHLGIDYLKSKNKDSFGYFIIDQLAHLAVLVALWIGIEGHRINLGEHLNALLADDHFWTVTAGYVFVSWPLGIIIGKATQKWRAQIIREKENSQPDPAIQPAEEVNTELPVTSQDDQLSPEARSNEEQELGLASAGKWIGICERILILTFVLVGQYTAIGFLMTAKSILRFSEKEANTQLKTEYVLVGTLVSFASSALVGALINLALKS